MFRRLQWNPLLVAIPVGYLCFTTYIQGFPFGRTAAAAFMVVWFGLSVYNTISGHKWLDWLYSDDDEPSDPNSDET